MSKIRRLSSFNNQLSEFRYGEGHGHDEGDQKNVMRALEFYDQLYNADMARYRSREDQGKLRSSLQICGPSPPLYSL